AATGWLTATRPTSACAWGTCGSGWTSCNGATSAGNSRTQHMLRRRRTRTPRGHEKRGARSAFSSSLERWAHGVPRGGGLVGMAGAQHRGLVEGPADHLEPYGQPFRRQPTGQRERREADQVGGIGVVQERALHSAARRALLG